MPIPVRRPIWRRRRRKSKEFSPGIIISCVVVGVLIITGGIYYAGTMVRELPQESDPVLITN
jgi:hypothetical protein